MKSRIMGCLTAVLIPVLGFGAAADEAFTLYNAEDASPAIRVKNGYKFPVTFIWLTAGSNANNRIEIKESSGAVTTNLINTVGATNTIGEMTTVLGAVSNAAGEKLLTYDYNCALSADEFSTRVLTETNIIAAGAWGKAATWDTSVALHYNVYVPGKIAESGGVEGRKVVSKLFGDVGGTGDVTLNVYEDGTEKYVETIRSPVYLQGATNILWASVATVNLSDKGFTWPCPRRTDVLIRATRATTGTTGGMGVTVVPAE
jgi:hypothetical protein